MLRFTTAAGIREIWVEYDGCARPGSSPAPRRTASSPAPLKLFMTGSVRPAGGIYLDDLKDW